MGNNSELIKVYAKSLGVDLLPEVLVNISDNKEELVKCVYEEYDKYIDSGVIEALVKEILKYTMSIITKNVCGRDLSSCISDERESVVAEIFRDVVDTVNTEKLSYWEERQKELNKHLKKMGLSGIGQSCESEESQSTEGLPSDLMG